MDIREIGKFIAAGKAMISLHNARTRQRYIYNVIKHREFITVNSSGT